MIWSITILLASFVSLTVLSIPDSDLWQEKFLHAVILTIVSSNVGVNVLQVWLCIVFSLYIEYFKSNNITLLRNLHL